MRYTDPSFFKVETASSGIATVDVQREKKIRKKVGSETIITIYVGVKWRDILVNVPQHRIQPKFLFD